MAVCETVLYAEDVMDDILRYDWVYLASRHSTNKKKNNNNNIGFQNH